MATNRQVANAWATGECIFCTATNFRTIGHQLFSYPICVGVLHPTLNLAILCSDHYSLTTTRHTSLGYRAALAKGYTIIEVPVPGDFGCKKELHWRIWAELQKLEEKTRKLSTREIENMINMREVLQRCQI